MPELILEIAALDYVFPAPHRRCVIASEGGTIGIRMDVTEIKQKEEQLAHQTALLQATGKTVCAQRRSTAV